MNEFSSFRLEPGQVASLSGTSYSFLKRVPGKKQFQNQTSGEITWIEERELNRALESGELQIQSHSSVPECRHDVQQLHFSDLPPETQHQARMRRDYVVASNRNADLNHPFKPREVIDNVFEQRRQTAFDAGEKFGEKKPGVSSVYEWRLAWNQPGRPNIMRLVFAECKRGRQGSKKGGRVQQIIADAIINLYLTPQRNLVSVVSDRVVAVCESEDIPKNLIPCERTVRRQINSESPRLLMEARHGKRTADLMYAGTHKMTVPEMPGEVLEVDAHKLNFLVVDDAGIVVGRLWVTVAIDRCSRVIVGFYVHVGPPSSLTIAACLANAFEQKAYMSRRWPDLTRPWVAWGVPVVVVLDNAFENKAEFLIQAAEEIGFAIFWAKPRTPEDKAHMERWFLTLENGLIRRLPGNTGLNPQDLGDYDACSMACATEEDINYLMHRYVTTIYNVALHRGINDIPERLWMEKVAKWEVAPFTGQNSATVLLGHIAWRVPSKKGIELLGLLYNGRRENNLIEFIRGRAGSANLDKLRVRFDPKNLDFIWVQDPVSGRYEMLESEDPDYTTGMTLARHRAIRKHALERSRSYLTVADLCASRDALQRQIEDILGTPHKSGRRTAYLLNSKGGAQKAELDALLMSVSDEADLIDLLDLEDSGQDHPGGSSVVSTPDTPDPLLSVTEAAPFEPDTQAPGSLVDAPDPSSDGESLAEGPMQPSTSDVADAAVTPGSTQPEQPVASSTAEIRAARMARLGLVEEDL